MLKNCWPWGCLGKKWLEFKLQGHAWVLIHSVVSDSLQPHGQWPARLLHPWNFPGKNAGVGSHFFLPEALPNQGMEPVSLESPELAGGFFYYHTTWKAQYQRISEEHKLIPERSEIKRKVPKEEIGYNRDKKRPGN